VTRAGQWIVQNIFTQSGAGADAAVRPEDRADFESWKLLDRFPDLSGRRSSAPSRWTARIIACSPLNARSMLHWKGVH
jgi:hypothetical protein